VVPYFFHIFDLLHFNYMADLVYKKESYNIIGVCLRVYNELGPGFLEAVYCKAMEKEFIQSGIPFKRQAKLKVLYKGEPLDKYYVADFISYENIIIEVKAVQYIPAQHLKQLHNYLKSTGKKLGLLVNFGGTSFEFKRVLNSSASEK
jgi:GxxExxY protein